MTTPGEISTETSDDGAGSEDHGYRGDEVLSPPSSTGHSRGVRLRGVRDEEGEDPGRLRPPTVPKTFVCLPTPGRSVRGTGDPSMGTVGVVGTETRPRPEQR